ncbi:hypothetical protein N7470_003693 [Penicillium chermesinum]|nr:hypothetical protein N7470_003693 [Penicillium chermesinum]
MTAITETGELGSIMRRKRSMSSQASGNTILILKILKIDITARCKSEPPSRGSHPVIPAPYTTQTTTDELVSDYAALIKDKVILTTGVSPRLLGYVLCSIYRQDQPAWLILAARNADKLAKMATEITTAHPEIQVRTLQVVDIYIGDREDGS